MRFRSVAILLALAVALGACGAPSEAEISRTTMVAVQSLFGTEGTIDSGADSAFIATSELVLLDLLKRSAANDIDGAAQLVVDGQVYEVPRGTKVRVTDVSGLAVRVRFLDGPKSGQEGWTPAEYVKR